MEALRKDVRYALRSLRRQPGFTAITILTLAFGIGANTAVFSVVNGVLLKPLPYPEPDELQYVSSQFPTLGFDQFWVSIPEFVEFRDHNEAFQSVGAFNVGAVNLGTDTPSRPVRAVVTAELMPTLGVAPLEGRWFTAEDTEPNAPAVAILSWELWQRSFGGERGVVGRTVQIDSQPVEVVGIMPKGFDVHDEKVELWEPLTIDPAEFPTRRGNHFLFLVGRLAPGVVPAQARADIDRLLGQWREFAPEGHVPSVPNHTLRMDPLKEDIVGGVRQALVVLTAAVGFVLLIACANLANLLVARADTRVREYAVRTALGATRGRLFRQMLTEGLILTTAAAVTGVALAYGGLASLIAIDPSAIPRTADVAIDRTVLVFTLAVAAGTGLVFAFVPLLHLGTGRLSEAIRESSTRTTSGARAWMRSGLVVAEVALAVTLVVGAGLLIRSFVNLTRVDMGFNRSELSTFSVVLPASTYTPQQRTEFFTRLTEAVGALPGVRTAAAMSGLPPLRQVDANDTDFEHITRTGANDPGPAENVDFYQIVTVGYTETMGIPVVAGRAFQPSDAFGQPVALVNETLAQRFFPDRNPIGGRLKPGVGPTLPWFEIVGVVKDVKQGGVAAESGTEVYFLAEQVPRVIGFMATAMHVVARSSRPLDSLAPDYRRIVREMDATLPVMGLQSMDDVIGAAVAEPRFITMLLGSFAALALVLAAVGTYGVLAYLIAERHQEIGIRMALGADRARILRLVLGHGLRLSGAGLLLGLAASAALTRVLASLLFGVTPTDPATLAAVSLVIIAVAAAACLVPALRATRIDPLSALRAD
jgi:putative ABC transport system permease protein